MRKAEYSRWECENCGTISFETHLLVAKNPFDCKDNITGCPNCKVVFGENLHAICDELKCDEHAHCGWPTGDNSDEFGGYRRTCGKHMKHQTE